MSNEHYKHNKYKQKYLKLKQTGSIKWNLIGAGDETDEEIKKENKNKIISLKKKIIPKNKENKSCTDLCIIVGAGNLDGTSSDDYSRFHKNFNVAITNDITLIDYKKEDLVGLCLNFNDYSNMFTLSSALSNLAERIVFDISVAKLIESGILFYQLFRLLKFNGTLTIDQTLSIMEYNDEKNLLIPTEIRSVTGKQYINHFMRGVAKSTISASQEDMSSYLPTDEKVIENNKKFLENINDVSYKFEVTVFTGTYPVEKYSDETRNKLLQSVTYFVAKKVLIK